VQAPLRRFTEADGVDFQVFALAQNEHLRAERLRQPPFVGLIVAPHELAGASIDVARSGDAQTFDGVRRDDGRALVLRGVGGGYEFGVVGKVEVDGAFEFEGPDEVFLTAANQNLGGFAGSGRSIDRLLDGG